jgi:hypothetical protein
MIDSRKFSIAHWDSVVGNSDMFYQAFKNSSESFKSEISDIYFGHTFVYKGGSYGNVMNCNAGDRQIDNLFKIQEEYSIPISLTLNDTVPDKKFLLDRDIQSKFIEYLRGFYDRGLRVCTIGDTHLINRAILQKAFPKMRWKNTVNNIVRDAQGVIDYAMLGYDTILINRNLHRDLAELKRIKKAVDWFNKSNPTRKTLETSLLVSEGCILNCPWKDVHDYHWGGGAYFNHFHDTCSAWRGNKDIHPEMPRNNPDAFWYDKEDWDEFAEYVNTFKYVGRTSKYPTSDNPVLGWVKSPFTFTQKKSHSSFNDVYNEELLLHQYQPGIINDSISEVCVNISKLKRLGKILRQCKGQCWNCHECEEAYDQKEMTSLIGVYNK